MEGSSSSIRDLNLGPNRDAPPASGPIHPLAYRLYALIIGINKFTDPQVKTLKGAVADANEIEKYLKKKLCVPDSHIKKLLDEEASRANIIQAFQDLINNTNRKAHIRKGDAILIFYAGHGKLVTAPDDWPTGRRDGKIQSIVPQDISTDRGKLVDVIPDITLGVLIRQISEKWGNNISVIFDCCYSGSGTRCADPDILCRGAMLENYSIPPDLDQELWYPPGVARGAKPAPFSDSQDSHILFAACGSDELAREEYGRGRFTTSLLKLLNNILPEEITYEEVLGQLEKIKDQTPQLEGLNYKRTLFSSRTTHVGLNYHRISTNCTSRRYEVKAGTAHGICKNAEFTIYSNKASLSEGSMLGVAVVESVESFHSILAVHPHLQLDPSMIAVQTKPGDEEEGVKLHLNPNSALYDEIQNGSTGIRRLAFVGRSAADLEIIPEGNQVAFKILDKNITDYGLLELFRLVDRGPDDVMSVLWAAAHYYHFLKRFQTDPQLHALIQNIVDIEFLRLDYSGGFNRYGKRIKRFVGKNLIVGDKITLDIKNKSDIYGIKITNKSQYPLYANVFYFNNTDLSIEQYYSSGGGNHCGKDASLGPSADLTLGYGPAGGAAYHYSVPDDRDVDVGFIKFFLSTSPVDLSSVKQESPFNNGFRATRLEDEDLFVGWGAIVIPIIQRRPKSQQQLVVSAPYST